MTAIHGGPSQKVRAIKLDKHDRWTNGKIALI
jgi:hypothetical protein